MERASLAYGRGDFAAGADELGAQRASCGDDREWLFWFGRLDMRAGRLDRATETFEHLLSLEPLHPSAAMLIAEIDAQRTRKTATETPAPAPPSVVASSVSAPAAPANATVATVANSSPATTVGSVGLVGLAGARRTPLWRALAVVLFLIGSVLVSFVVWWVFRASGLRYGWGSATLAYFIGLAWYSIAWGSNQDWISTGLAILCAWAVMKMSLGRRPRQPRWAAS